MNNSVISGEFRWKIEFSPKSADVYVSIKQVILQTISSMQNFFISESKVDFGHFMKV